MKLNKLVLAVAVTSALTATTANATFLLPTSYDKQQDQQIGKNASDISDLKAKDDVLDKKINDTYAYVNTKYTEAAGKNLERQVADLQENKVDKSVFTADQERQDKALADAVSNQAKVDAKQTSDLKGYADAKATSAYTTSVAHTDAKVARADADRKAGDDALNTRIDDAISYQTDRDAAQDEHINAVQSAAQTANDRATNLEVRADASEQAIRDTQGAAQTANDRATALEGRADSTEATLADHDGRITNAQNTADSAVSIGQNATNLANTAQSTADTAIKGVQSNSNRITNVETVQSQHSTTLNDHETRITSNTNEIKKTQTVVNKHTDQLANHETRITNTETNVSNLTNEYYQFQDTYNYNNQVINQNMQSYRAQAVQQSKAYTDQQVGQLRNDWRQGRSDDQKEYRSGIASVAAMANIPVVPGQRLTVGAGIGQFKDRTALAVGVGANITPNVAAKASVGFSNDSDAVVGAGIGFGF